MKKSENFFSKLKSLKGYLDQRQKIYILPTATGFGLLGSVLFCLAAGVIYTNNLMYLLSFLLMTLFAVIMVMTHRNLHRVEFEKLIIQSNFVGVPLLVYISLRNPTADEKRHILARLKLPERAQVKKVSSAIDLRAKDSGVITLAVNFSRRGQYSLNRFTLETRFPFGLFRAWQNCKISSDFFVYPEPLGALALAAKQTSEQMGNENWNTQRKEEFFDLGQYQVGESLAKVHWSSFAKHRQLVSKKFGVHGSDFKTADFQALSRLTLEKKLSQMSLWIKEAMAGRYCLEVKNFGDKKRILRSKAEFESVLTELAIYGEQS